MATAIFFASSTGNSEEIANKIASKLGDIEVFDLAGTKIDKINEYDKLAKSFEENIDIKKLMEIINI